SSVSASPDGHCAVAHNFPAACARVRRMSATAAPSAQYWSAQRERTRVSPDDTDVLIVGAGPTGLVLALWLSHLGIRFRIVDQVLEPGTTSRALVLHARTLELYRQLGIA